MAVYGPQRKRGYTDVLYNVKQNKFYAPLRGDNYYELDVEIGGSGPGGSAETNNVVLSNVDTSSFRAKSVIPAPDGLKTQADYNQWNYDALISLESAVEAIEIPEGQDLSEYALKTEIPTDNVDLANGAGYITLSEVPETPEFPDVYTKTESDAKYLAVNISSLSELPTV